MAATLQFYLRVLPHRADKAYCAIVATDNPTGRGSMDTDTQAKQRVSVDLPTEPSGPTVPVEARVSDADLARSEENILQWTSYLPEDCVKAMIAMGWDVGT
jgi:hypothetical protein